MGLYGERVGALHIVTGSAEIAERVMSQVKILIRVMYSSPPRHGAQIAGLILTTPELRQQWLNELVTVTNRMNEMRKLLRGALEKVGAKGSWDHVTNQIGMFSFTGLTVA
jgi:aspartate/tyrosine/aromatic aminotransferase